MQVIQAANARRFTCAAGAFVPKRRGTPLAAIDFDAFASGVTPCF